MRAFDVAVSLVALAVLSPVLLLIAAAVKLSSPGPVLHRARRVGQHGHVFTLYKFRSMVVDAAQHGPLVTGANDPRITRVGSILRRTKIDELPQLFNTLRGDMSLVGPRPEDPTLVAAYSPDQRRVLAVKPGITSPATVLHRYEEDRLRGPRVEDTYVREILPAKLQIELDYLRRRTFVEDLRVLAHTFTALFARRQPLGPNGDSEWRV
jgi:lipopolysaccharide/colanic/teichoic acid biosynthesis glycosyltransferase